MYRHERTARPLGVVRKQGNSIVIDKKTLRKELREMAKSKRGPGRFENVDYTRKARKQSRKRIRGELVVSGVKPYDTLFSQKCAKGPLL